MFLSSTIRHNYQLTLRIKTKYISYRNISRRCLSTTAAHRDSPKINSEVIDLSKIDNFYLPEPPIAPDLAPVIESLNRLGEATFSSLGLNSNWPTGWAQAAYEWMHVQANLPWWAAVAASAVILRLVMLPLSYKVRKITALASGVTPKLLDLERRRQRAQSTNDSIAMTKVIIEYKKTIQETNYSPQKLMIYNFLQFPPFIIIMLALRGMANLPVASLQTGGIFWFTDLTVCDPYYILPVTTMLLVLIQIETGADIGTDTTFSKKKWILRCMPVVGIILTSNLPSALLLYWLSSSVMSLSIAGVMSLPFVKSRYNIPKPQVSSVSEEDKKVGFVKKLKLDWKEKETIARAKRIASTDNENWIKAGKATIPKTFSYDPTKVKDIAK